MRVVAPEPLEVLDIVTEEIESKGMGPKVGFSGRYSFTKNFSVYGGMNVSFIPGKIDSLYISHNDLERFDPDSEDEWGPFVFSLNRPKRDENFVMYDFDAGFRMAIAQKLNILFGYRFTKMENVIYRMRFIPDKDLSDLHANWDAAFSSQHSVNYAGLYFGVAYEF